MMTMWKSWRRWCREDVEKEKRNNDHFNEKEEDWNHEEDYRIIISNKIKNKKMFRSVKEKKRK